MNSERPLIAVVGSLHYDIMLRTPYLPRLGETLMGSAWGWKAGGKGGNQATAAARHGGNVAMIGALGADDFAVKLRHGLRSAGVGLGHVRTVETGSGMSVAMVEAGGDYSAVVVTGANASIDADQIAGAAELLREAKVLVLQNEIGEAANSAAARIVKAAGGRVVLNAAPARTLGRELAGNVDVLLVNAIEAEMLGAGPVDSLVSASAAARYLQTVAPSVVVTAGAQGVAFCLSGDSGSLAAHPVAQAQTHGAGDVFVGALAARLAADDGLPTALAYANAAAALHVGADEAKRALIGRADVRAFLGKSAGPIA